MPLPLQEAPHAEIWQAKADIMTTCETLQCLDVYAQAKGKAADAAVAIQKR